MVFLFSDRTISFCCFSTNITELQAKHATPRAYVVFIILVEPHTSTCWFQTVSIFSHALILHLEYVPTSVTPTKDPVM
jgi:hypothetical protein